MEKRDGEGTKFTIDRKIFTSDIWFASPWKLKIWIYLLGNAGYKDTKIKSKIIKRGEMATSYRMIADGVGYYEGNRLVKPSPNTVMLICEELRKEGRIGRVVGQLGTIIKILNYNKLQSLGNQHTGQPIGQGQDTHRTPIGQQLETIFNTWNEQNIIIHKKLTDKIKTKINSALNDYTEEEIIGAIKNYAEILQSDKYMWTYKWGIEDFLQRGIKKFLSALDPHNNYLIKDNKPTRKHWEPKFDKDGKPL